MFLACLFCRMRESWGDKVKVPIILRNRRIEITDVNENEVRKKLKSLNYVWQSASCEWRNAIVHNPYKEKEKKHIHTQPGDHHVLLVRFERENNIFFSSFLQAY